MEVRTSESVANDPNGYEERFGRYAVYGVEWNLRQAAAAIARYRFTDDELTRFADLAGVVAGTVMKRTLEGGAS